MNCNLNGINDTNCSLSIGGIHKVFVWEFDKINQYTYTNDDLNYITGYSALSLPILYKPNQLSSEYTGNKSERNYKLYDHQLVLNFLKMSINKRQEFRALENKDLTIIFQDRNQNCWIMGQDTPVRLSTNQVGTGVKDGINGYEITLVSQEKQQLRGIECPSEGCFTSFTATEFRRTTFIIPNSDTYDWNYIETDVNGILVDLTLNQPLNPSLWNTNPLVLAHDRQILLQLFTSANGIVDTLTTTHDNSTNVTTISIDSNESSYGTLQIDNTVFNKDSYLATLNLTTILSTGIANPSTIIEVRDSLNNVVYSGGYSTSIANGTTLQGTTDNATLIMSDLYPTGTTLTVQLTNIPCSNVVYTYNYVNTLEACVLERNYSFNKDKITKIHVPYITNGGISPITQRYQNLTINIYGTSFQLYKNSFDWHDDFNTFVNDVTLKFYQVNLPIDLNSLVFTDTGTGVDIQFNLTDNIGSYYFRQQMVGYSEELISDDWTQGRSVNIQTIAPVGSTITHTDSHTHEMIGENFINITSNNFDLAYNPLGNISVDNVSLLWAFDDSTPYSSNDIIETTSLGGNCNTPTVKSPFDTCYEDFISTFNGSLELISLDCSAPSSINMGNSFTLIYNQGFGNIPFSFITPSSITPNSGIHYLIDKVNTIKGVKIVHYDFDIVNRVYRLFFHLDSNVSIISLTDNNNNRYFNLGVLNPIYTNTLTRNINPFIGLSWFLPTTLPSSNIPAQDLRGGYWELQNTSTAVVNIIWNQSTDTLTINKQTGFDNSITIALHEVYPTYSNQVLFDVVGAGSTGTVITSVSSKLINNGATLASTNYISYRNNMGWMQVLPIDLVVGSSELQFSEVIQTPMIWGTVDNLNYVGTQTLTQPQVFSGVDSCYNCCGGSFIPSGYAPSGVNIIKNEINPNVFEMSVSFDMEIDCKVDYLVFEIENSNPPEPTPLLITLSVKDCVNGMLTFTANDDNYLTFLTNPAGSENDVVVEMFDQSNNSLGDFEVTIEF